MKTSFFDLSNILLIGAIFLLFSCEKPEESIISPDIELEASVKPKPIVRDTVKILAIGNSFSEDALESHLYELAKADGKSIIIGNLHIGGATLEQHLKNAKENSNAYSFRKIDVKGKKTILANTSIAKALASEKWTHISYQQASPVSGIYNTWASSLPELYTYVLNNKSNKNTKFIIHQTWAFAASSSDSGFKNYNKDQIQMYKSIVDAVIRSVSLVKIDFVVPTGTAIQNGRTSAIGDNFTRDGKHLSLPLGRYLAACTWYESLFDRNVINNSYKPTGLSSFEIAVAQNAAHRAILKPNEVTAMNEFLKQ